MNLIKKYNFSGLITQKDIDTCIQDIDEVFANSGWMQDRPTFQTYGYLFEYRPLLYKFKQSFIFSCLSYLKKDIKHFECKAWCYMDYHDNWIKKDQEEMWHKHSDNTAPFSPNLLTDKLSGIFYLRIPDADSNHKYPTTEFKDDSDIFFEDFTWFIYPSDLIHRPGKILSNEKRYCLGADFFYFDI